MNESIYFKFSKYANYFMKKIYILIFNIGIYVSHAYSQWSLTGNSISSSNFLGTNNANNLVFKVNNANAGLLDMSYNCTFFGLSTGGIAGSSSNYNTAFGNTALQMNATGTGNVAIGYLALPRNSNGTTNTAIGVDAMYSNSNGASNTAVGPLSLYYNTTGILNCAFGSNSLQDNTTGSYNCGLGSYALFSNTTGSYNTACGYQASYSNTNANCNTVIGNYALYSNSTGSYNVATGVGSLYSSQSGSYNTSIGYHTLYANINGSKNTAVGDQALSAATGSQNTALGNSALGSTTSDNNTAAGHYVAQANTSGSSITAIGNFALNHNISGTNNVAVGWSNMTQNVTGSYNTAVGPGGPVSSNLSYTIAIGGNVSSSYQAIIGNTSTSLIGGYVNWSVLSDGRFKKNIQENVPGLEFISQLRQVSYTLDFQGIDQTIEISKKFPKNEETNNKVNYPNNLAIEQREKAVYSGFIAQEVYSAANNLNYHFSGVVQPKNNGDFYGLRYADFIPSLVKAVQQISHDNDDLVKYISDLRFRINNMKQQLAYLKSRKSKLKLSASSSNNKDDSDLSLTKYKQLHSTVYKNKLIN